MIKEAKEYNKTQDFKDDMRERDRIEPKQVEIKLFHGLAKAKYWGLPKMTINYYCYYC